MNSTLQSESYYRVVDGIIRSPGKFEGEADYVPYLHDISLNGCCETHDEYVYIEIDAADRLAFPSLKDTAAVILYERSDGFVQCEAYGTLIEAESYWKDITHETHEV